MDRLPYGTPPRWWAPRLRPLFIRAIRPLRLHWQRRRERVTAVEACGLDNLRRALDQDCGVLITPNHAAHSDPFVFLNVADQAGRPFYYLAAWQSFQILRPLARWVIQRHGCFSVDREGNDFRAFRQAVAVLQQGKHPLVIFPEGEVYHHSERVARFRTGAAAIALAAARKPQRPILCLPTVVAYRYVEDPLPELHRLMEVLERKLLWQPRPDLPLAERVFRLAEALVTLRELEYLGHVRRGLFRERVAVLVETILRRLEAHYAVGAADEDVPGRVTLLRRQAIKTLESALPTDPQAHAAQRNLEDLYVAVQLFSYADDYDRVPPSVEHLAEIIDKFEEDVLGVVTAHPRAARQATVVFGQPIEVGVQQERKEAARRLTETLEQEVRRLLEDLLRPAVRKPAEKEHVVGLA